VLLSELGKRLRNFSDQRNEDSAYYHDLIRSMLSTLKELKISIRELTWIVKKGYCTEEGRQHLVDRIKNLKDTQFKIAFSVQDLKSDIVKTIGSKEDREAIKTVFDHNNLIKKLRVS
jgi:hypothetical protein